jgi:hypothetical protein
MTDTEEHILQQLIAFEGIAKAACRNWQKEKDGKCMECLHTCDKISAELQELIPKVHNESKGV